LSNAAFDGELCAICSCSVSIFAITSSFTPTALSAGRRFGFALVMLNELSVEVRPRGLELDRTRIV
jgi:hypothetical protein